MENHTAQPHRDAIDAARDAAVRVLPVEPHRVDAVAEQVRVIDRRVRTFVREHPTTTVLGAIAVGFLIGRLVRR